MRALARPLICIPAFALRPCSLLALLLYVRSWKRSGNGDNEGGECPDDPEIICGESFWQFSLGYYGNKDKDLKQVAWYQSRMCDAKDCPHMLLSSLRVMGPEASSSCARPSCVDGYKIVKLSNSPRKKTKRMSVPQQENLIPLSPGGSAIMLNKFVEKLVKQQSQPPQPPQPPRSLEEQTEIAGEKESVAQKKLEHAKKLAENEPKNPRLSADVETHQKLFDARHRQHMILVAKLAKQLEEELAAQLVLDVDDSG